MSIHAESVWVGGGRGGALWGSSACFLYLRYFSLEEALAVVGEKLCVELSLCLSQHGYPQLSAEQRNNLKGQISATVQPDNRVRKLMGR